MRGGVLLATLFLLYCAPVAIGQGPGIANNYFTHCTYHGYLEIEGHVCQCIEGRVGPDCSQKACPRGYSWAGAYTSTDDAHPMAECSDMGYCDRDTGKCECVCVGLGVHSPSLVLFERTRAVGSSCVNCSLTHAPGPLRYTPPRGRVVLTCSVHIPWLPCFVQVTAAPALKAQRAIS